jgi:signal transduction histidine kinase
LGVTVALLLLSAIAYYFVINYLLIHELDEELDNYKQKIETYAGKTGILPEPGVMEDLKVRYELTAQNSSPVSYVVKDEYDSAEQAVESFRQLIYTQKAGDHWYKVVIGKPLEGTRLLGKTIAYCTLGILIIIILTSLLLNRFLLKKLWRPFYETINVVKHFKLAGKNAPEFPKTRIDEFVVMNNTLNDTIQSAQTDYRLLKEFTENASHEVQTPLAIIRSKLDLLIQEESLSEKQVKILDGAYAAIKRISKLNQSLLLLAKIENNQFADIQFIDLKKELSEKMEQFKEFWQNNQIHITASLEESFIKANHELVDILLNNLLGNAGMHNVEGGKVDIKLTASQLVISNTGSPQHLDKQRLFRRFYKEAQHSRHNGLGLSIIKQICDQTGIEIQYSFAENFHTFSLSWSENTPR